MSCTEYKSRQAPRNLGRGYRAIGIAQEPSSSRPPPPEESNNLRVTVINECAQKTVKDQYGLTPAFTSYSSVASHISLRGRIRQYLWMEYICRRIALQSRNASDALGRWSGFLLTIRCTSGASISVFEYFYIRKW